MFKSMIAFLLLFISYISIGQITSIDYVLDYNCEKNEYEVYIKANEGSAHTILERAQFNCQISFAVPTGSDVVINGMYAPIQNNQYFDGTVPLRWILGNGVISPDGFPELDFHNVIPTLAPSAFYNEINEDDEILLFTFTTGEKTEYSELVRLFDNENDPAKSDFNGSDLRNGFTIGGPIDVYNGNVERNCLTSVLDGEALDIEVYPNPASHKLFLESNDNLTNVSLVDSVGNKLRSIDNPTSGTLEIDIEGIVPGIYFLNIRNQKRVYTHQVAIF